MFGVFPSSVVFETQFQFSLRTVSFTVSALSENQFSPAIVIYDENIHECIKVPV